MEDRITEVAIKNFYLYLINFQQLNRIEAKVNRLCKTFDVSCYINGISLIQHWLIHH